MADRYRHQPDPRRAVRAPDTRIDLGFEYPARPTAAADRGVPSRRVRRARSTASTRPSSAIRRRQPAAASTPMSRPRASSIASATAAPASRRSTATMTNSIRTSSPPVRATDGRDGGASRPIATRTDPQNLFIPERPRCDVATAGIDHTLLLGVDFGRPGQPQPADQRLLRRAADDQRDQRTAGVGDESTADHLPRTGRRQSRGRSRRRRDRRSMSRTRSGSATMSRSSPACARLVRARRRQPARGRRRSSARTTSWSPRLGLVVKPTPTCRSTPASRSFLPQSGDQFSSLDVDARRRSSPSGSTISRSAPNGSAMPGCSTTLAVYQLDRTNTRATDPVPAADRPHRRAAQPRASSSGSAQHHRPLADLRPAMRCRKREDPRDHRGRARTAATCRWCPTTGFAVEPLRLHAADRAGLGVYHQSK